jgi:uncharacterized membrane protein YraQ (UPF0718 family)
MFMDDAKVRPAIWVFFALMILLLVAGTLQVDFLTKAFVSIDIFQGKPVGLNNGLESVGLDIQGALIIGFLTLTGLFAWKGFDHESKPINGWNSIAMGLVLVTLLIASPKVSDSPGMVINITGRAIAITILLGSLVLVARFGLSRDEIGNWLWETWKFVRQIFPLLILGVFVAGIVKEIIPEEWVRTLAGRNTVMANFIGVVFGVFMYFPTLVEVPIARMFLDLGMHKGPLLAYLLADPALSLQSVLVTGRILGRRKTAVYVVLVSIFSTVAGYLFGFALTAL